MFNFEPQRRTLVKSLPCLLLATPVIQAAAQQTVRVVVPFAAGSSTDQLARQLTDSMREITGNTYIMENKRVPAASSARLTSTSQSRTARPFS